MKGKRKAVPSPASNRTAPKSQDKLNSSQEQVQGLPRDNSAKSQRARVLNHLRVNGSLTTLEARSSMLDILHPAARCQELRQMGYPIETVWTNDFSACGKSHRIARYVLRTSRQQSLFDLFDKEGGANDR